MSLSQLAITPLCQSCERTGATTVQHIDEDAFLVCTPCGSIVDEALRARLLPTPVSEPLRPGLRIVQ